MNHGQKIAREDAIADCLRAANEALGDAEPDDQAIAIMQAIAALRSDQPVAIPRLQPVDYLERVQEAARALWAMKHANDGVGPGMDAVAGVDTPLGRLKAVTWKRVWTGKKGQRVIWASEYYLNDELISIAEIRAAGLAQRPTTRPRRKKGQAQ